MLKTEQETCIIRNQDDYLKNRIHKISSYLRAGR